MDTILKQVLDSIIASGGDVSAFAKQFLAAVLILIQQAAASGQIQVPATGGGFQAIDVTKDFQPNPAFRGISREQLSAMSQKLAAAITVEAWVDGFVVAFEFLTAVGAGA